MVQDVGRGPVIGDKLMRGKASVVHDKVLELVELGGMT